MKKNKKSVKKTEALSAFDFGLELEQKFADTIVNKHTKTYSNEGEIDDIFLAAFQSFVLRMINVYDEETVHEMVSSMGEIADEEYVCEDCQKESDKEKAVVPTKTNGTFH